MVKCLSIIFLQSSLESQKVLINYIQKNSENFILLFCLYFFHYNFHVLNIIGLHQIFFSKCDHHTNIQITSSRKRYFFSFITYIDFHFDLLNLWNFYLSYITSIIHILFYRSKVTLSLFSWEWNGCWKWSDHQSFEPEGMVFYWVLSDSEDVLTNVKMNPESSTNVSLTFHYSEFIKELHS